MSHETANSVTGSSSIIIFYHGIYYCHFWSRETRNRFGYRFYSIELFVDGLAVVVGGEFIPLVGSPVENPLAVKPLDNRLYML